MRAIQRFSIVPLLQGRQASGLYGAQKDISLPRCVLLCMELSALQWRRLNAPVTLYTDTPMRDYLVAHRLLDCWDKVDTKTLDGFYRNGHGIDFKAFWSAGKFACYEQERAPFACIDTDLVVWKRLSFSPDVDFGFAHWERIEAGDESYPDPDQIRIPPGYELFPCESFDPLACNMAITYLGNDGFRKELAARAMSFMRGNHLDPGTRYAVPEILYMEQRLPLAIAKRDGLACAPVLECTWSPKNFRIVHPDKLSKNWFFRTLIRKSRLHICGSTKSISRKMRPKTSGTVPRWRTKSTLRGRARAALPPLKDGTFMRAATGGAPGAPTS